MYRRVFRLCCLKLLPNILTVLTNYYHEGKVYIRVTNSHNLIINSQVLI